jgi:hypothetical protein
MTGSADILAEQAVMLADWDIAHGMNGKEAHALPRLSPRKHHLFSVCGLSHWFHLRTMYAPTHF